MKENNVTISLKIVKDKQINMTLDKLLKEIGKEILDAFTDKDFKIYQDHPYLKCDDNDGNSVTVELVKDELYPRAIVDEVITYVSR